jgi:hypothetical protein
VSAAPGRPRLKAHARQPRVAAARSAYVTFWAISLICAAGAYVLTTLVPADRYFLVEIPLVAVSVSLLLDGGPPWAGLTRRTSRRICTGRSTDRSPGRIYHAALVSRDAAKVPSAGERVAAATPGIDQRSRARVFPYWVEVGLL